MPVLICSRRIKEVSSLSFLLNGDKMRQRLAQMLEQATESEQKHEKSEANSQSSISYTSPTQ